MSLLTRPRHRLVVTPQTVTKDRYGGNKYTPGTPVTVMATVFPETSSGTEATDGLRVTNRYTVIGVGDWPGGPHSTVQWNGRTLSQDGDALVYAVGLNTNHYTVSLVQAGTEAR